MNIKEVISVAFQSVKTNKLRTLLTILGIVVGIFSIIVIMTIITMLQNSIESGLAMLNKNTFQIQKFPIMHEGGPGSRDRFRNRKDITIEDYYRLNEMLTQAKYIGAEQWQWGIIVKFGNDETNPNIQLAGVTTDAMHTNDWNVAYGRDLRETDVQYSNDVCLLGADVADKLFPAINPIGQVVRVDGKPFAVIGVLESQPSMFGDSRNNFVVLPITTFQSIYGRRSRSINITVMSYSKQDYNETIEAAIGYMRTIRKVGPGEENDFDIFSNESLIGQMNDITGGVKIGALVVSIIALLAAGIGIMNIMLVSVTERTKEIGIRKAVGAKKINILSQFLFEAIFLCLLGGFIGIVLGVGIGNFAGSMINAQTAIPYDWVVIGLLLCVTVGIIFGTYPAYKAANLDPIEALRYE
ncbi:MAG: peptide ABC transporter permease [Ignavibacteria bacterium RBG_16_34_14]|nr:MAG: peptide ABC transporter permease [Ignavibacteria bacterium RBG_16_34_14]